MTTALTPYTLPRVTAAQYAVSRLCCSGMPNNALPSAVHARLISPFHHCHHQPPHPTHILTHRQLASRAAQALLLLRTLSAANINRLVNRLSAEAQRALRDLVCPVLLFISVSVMCYFCFWRAGDPLFNACIHALLQMVFYQIFHHHHVFACITRPVHTHR